MLKKYNPMTEPSGIFKCLVGFIVSLAPEREGAKLGAGALREE